MTLQMYAKRKEWNLQEVVVHLNHEKDYAADCAACETPDAIIDRFDRKIELKGNLDATQKERLMQIADKCPVHKTLHNDVHVQTSMIEKG